MRFVYLLILLFLFGCAHQAIPFEINDSVENDSVITTNTSDSEFLTLVFQPMQCTLTPWDAWYEEGNIQFIKAPTSEELIAAFYGSKNVSFESVIQIMSEDPVCEACDVCPTSESYVLEAMNTDEFLADGWVLE